MKAPLFVFLCAGIAQACVIVKDDTSDEGGGESGVGTAGTVAAGKGGTSGGGGNAGHAGNVGGLGGSGTGNAGGVGGAGSSGVAGAEGGGAEGGEQNAGAGHGGRSSGGGGDDGANGGQGGVAEPDAGAAGEGANGGIAGNGAGPGLGGDGGVTSGAGGADDGASGEGGVGGDSGAPGSACQVTGQCAPGEVCVGSANAKICVNDVDACQCPVNVNQFCDRGVCGPIPLRGSPCGDGGVCRLGSYCHPESGLCTALPDFGERCTADGSCRSNWICDDAGSCTFSPPWPICDDGWCRLPPVVGNPCLSNGWCENAYCAEGTCAAWPASGEACTPDGGCSFGNYCDEGQCRVLPGAGESCTIDGSCRAGHLCVDGLCEPLPVEGEPCLEEGVCEAGLGCDFDSVCRRPPRWDEPCAQTSLPCPDGAYCSEISGACRPRPRAGGVCEGVGEGVCPPGAPYCSSRGICDGCEHYGTQSVCSEGRFCWRGHCETAFPAGFFQSCSADVFCETSAFCSKLTGYCEVLPGPGEACVEGQRLSADQPYEDARASCAVGSHCRNVEACTGLLGEVPQTDCVCDPDPSEGESCEDFACAPGLHCVEAVLDGRCEPG